MENFIAYNPTKLHFGSGVVRNLGKAAKEYGKKVLLVYGKGSVLRNGSYEQTRKQLENVNIDIIEYTGIKPNPVVDDVDAAARLGLSENSDLIVAIGGGSVIDSAKIISVCIAEKCKGWDVMKNRVNIKSSVPLIAVLTLSATGTEMNAVSVLQNTMTREKIGFGHPSLFPRHSFLDPTFTETVPANYTAYGIVDLIAHALENFFGQGEASLSDRFVEAIIKEAFDYGPKLMKDLSNYDLRARIMWAATNALNGLTGYGRTSGDWGVHAIGHVLSFLYDTPHGATLSIAYPAWLKFMKTRIPDRIKKLGEHLYGESDADIVIAYLEKFFRSLNSPVRLQETGIEPVQKNEILELMNMNMASGQHLLLNNDDRLKILDLMFG